MSSRGRNVFAPKRSVRLVVEDGMEVDALSIIRALPDFQKEITGVVPLYGGRCFDITLRSPESATRLASIGFDYESSIKPLRLLGAKSIHVSIFLPVEYPDTDLVQLLKGYGQLKNENLRRLYYAEPGFTHIERGIRVAEFTKIEKDMPRKLVIGGVELHFKYTGQPMACYRCGSADHLVQACPKPARNRSLAKNSVQEESTSQEQTSLSTLEEMDATETPATNEETDSYTQDSTDTETPSYSAVTQNLFDSSDSSRKRRPPSPVPEDNPAAKKSSNNDKQTSYQQAFLQALKEKGPNRTKLIQKVDGDRFYAMRSFYLQYALGNFTDADPRSIGRHNVNSKEKEKWKNINGTIKQDAFGRIIANCEDLRKAHPDLF